MELFERNSSSLRPMKRPKEYYDANDSFIVRLPSNLRGNGEPEFHIGKDILNRSDRYADWGGNEVLSRMQRKYCFTPTNCRIDLNVKNSLFSYEAVIPNLSSPSNSCSTPKELPQKSQLDNSQFRTDDMPSWLPPNSQRNGNNNQSNWAASDTGPVNNWPASQTRPMNNWPTSQTGPVNNWPALQRGPMNNWPASQTGPVNNWPASQTGSVNNWTASQTRPVNNWPASQMAPTNNWPVKQFQNPVGLHNPSYCNDYKASNEQKTSGMVSHSKKNKFNHNKKNGYYIRPQVENNQSFNELLDHQLPYNQKENAQGECKHLNSPEEKEKPQKIQGSKLLSSLPVYPNEKEMVNTLKTKKPKCVIFADLNRHHRFLHKLSQRLPADIHLIIFFDNTFKFPSLVNASLEQLIKTECLHIHPDSNSRKARSQQYIENTINRSHKEIFLDVTFILLIGENPRINGVRKNLIDSGRPVVTFMPSFDFSEFYSIFKKYQTNSSPLS